MTLSAGTNMWVLTLFMVVFSVIFLWISQKVPGRQTGNRTSAIVNFRLWFILLATLYIILAQFSGYSALVVNQENATTPFCELAINSTTTNQISNITKYTYINTCAGITPPPIQSAWFTIITWTMIFEVYMAVFLLIITFFWAVRRW